MKNAIKVSAFALFSLFLTACDKPATTAEMPKVEKAPQAQPEIVQTNTEAEDYKKFHEWQQIQEKALSDAITTSMEKLGDSAKDKPEVVQETINKAVLAQIEQIQQSATLLEIRDPKVNSLKEKALEAMTLGAKMITESEKLAKNPTEEAHKAFGELQAQLMNVAAEGQKIEAELAVKYAPAPAEPTPMPDQNPPSESAPQQ